MLQAYILASGLGYSTSSTYDIRAFLSVFIINNCMYSLNKLRLATSLFRLSS